MFNNESVMKSIARHVFPDLGAFSADGHAELGDRDVVLHTGRGATWLTVSHGRDELFRIETRGGRVEAVYALPAVMEMANGEKFHGTAWANSRRWHVGGWGDIPRVSKEIREFFDNDEEWDREEAGVRKTPEEVTV